MVFPFLAGKLMSRNLKWFIDRHFETVRPIFDFFDAFWIFFKYFTSDPNFNAKFVLESMFLMLGPYGPPLDH